MRQYSELRKMAQAKRKANLVYRADILDKQVEALRILLNGITLDLEDCCLRYFDLTGLDLKNINLKGAYLQGAQLSENVVVPSYTHSDRTLLFDKWLKGNDEEKKIYQDLLNSGVNLFWGVDNDRMRAIDWGSKNLKNAGFLGAQLKNCNFIGVNLKEINLGSAHLKGVRLSEKVVVPDELLDPNQTLLFDKWTEGSEEEQSLYQDLLNNGVRLFYGVINDRMRAVDWGSKNLKNTNISHADLQNCNLSELNAPKAYLMPN